MHLKNGSTQSIVRGVPPHPDLSSLNYQSFLFIAFMGEVNSILFFKHNSTIVERIIFELIFIKSCQHEK